ncbi:MAG: hypothetical protein JW889_16330 [Verrucomicrobia bacterium]|nr:hypothetical protein [Verrucomicrobiota bacterium]
MRQLKPDRNRGIALAVVLVIVFVIAIIAAAFLSVVGSDVHLTYREVELTRSFYVAQAGIEKAVAELNLLFSKAQGYSSTELAEIIAPQFDGYTFEEFSVVAIGESYEDVLSAGNYAGLRGRIQRIKITAVVSSHHSGETTCISEEVEAQFIPIFQFAIFYYEDDLEILPGPAMTVSGPVHCNSDIYVGSHTGLTFESLVTAAGNIYHGRKDSSDTIDAPVLFKDKDGLFQNMRNPDGTWLDSRHAEWFEGATERWDGNVASSVHRVNPLRLALATSDRSHEIIERGSAADSPETKEVKYYHKADLRIIDGQAETWDGWSVDLSYPDPSDPTKTLNPVSTQTFYNFREGKTVSVTQIDVAMLRESGKMPANGILYVSDYRNFGGTKQDAVRLVNGTQLPDGGLTVVTDNPLYIQGDYNTVNQQPASVMCDAVNILSNNWKDSNSAKSLSSRVASNTAINAAIAAGNTVTTEGQYNGGVENMPRFLETWSGKTLTYRGSLAALWQSETATGDWIYGSPVYEAPNRNWGYDQSLADPAKAPPGMPSVFTIEVARWRYE